MEEDWAGKEENEKGEQKQEEGKEEERRVPMVGEDMKG